MDERSTNRQLVVYFPRMDTSSFRVGQEVSLVAGYGVYPLGTMARIAIVNADAIWVAVGLSPSGGHQRIRIDRVGIIKPLTSYDGGRIADQLREPGPVFSLDK